MSSKRIVFGTDVREETHKTRYVTETIKVPLVGNVVLERAAVEEFAETQSKKSYTAFEQ